MILLQYYNITKYIITISQKVARSYDITITDNLTHNIDITISIYVFYM